MGNVFFKHLMVTPSQSGEVQFGREEIIISETISSDVHIGICQGRERRQRGKK